MTCPTCEGPLPQNDDRFLPWCSEDCMRRPPDDNRLAATAVSAMAEMLTAVLGPQSRVSLVEMVQRMRDLSNRLESGQSTVVGADYLRALEKVAEEARRAFGCQHVQHGTAEPCAPNCSLPSLKDALAELDKVKP